MKPLLPLRVRIPLTLSLSPDAPLCCSHREHCGHCVDCLAFLPHCRMCADPMKCRPGVALYKNGITPRELPHLAFIPHCLKRGGHGDAGAGAPLRPFPTSLWVESKQPTSRSLHPTQHPARHRPRVQSCPTQWDSAPSCAQYPPQRSPPPPGGGLCWVWASGQTPGPASLLPAALGALFLPQPEKPEARLQRDRKAHSWGSKTSAGNVQPAHTGRSPRGRCPGAPSLLPHGTHKPFLLDRKALGAAPGS